jgi:hypothetical protein
MQLRIGERPRIAWLAFPEDGGSIAEPGSQISIEAIV